MSFIIVQKPCTSVCVPHHSVYYPTFISSPFTSIIRPIPVGRLPSILILSGQAGGVHFTPRLPNKITKYYYYIETSSRALIYSASHAIIQVIVPILPIVQFPKQLPSHPSPLATKRPRECSPCLDVSTGVAEVVHRGLIVPLPVQLPQ